MLKNLVFKIELRQILNLIRLGQGRAAHVFELKRTSLRQCAEGSFCKTISKLLLSLLGSLPSYCPAYLRTDKQLVNAFSESLIAYG